MWEKRERRKERNIKVHFLLDFGAHGKLPGFA